MLLPAPLFVFAVFPPVGGSSRVHCSSHSLINSESPGDCNRQRRGFLNKQMSSLCVVTFGSSYIFSGSEGSFQIPMRARTLSTMTAALAASP